MTIGGIINSWYKNNVSCLDHKSQHLSIFSKAQSHYDKMEVKNLNELVEEQTL